MKITIREHGNNDDDIAGFEGNPFLNVDDLVWIGEKMYTVTGRAFDLANSSCRVWVVETRQSFWSKSVFGKIKRFFNH